MSAGEWIALGVVGALLLGLLAAVRRRHIGVRYALVWLVYLTGLLLLILNRRRVEAIGLWLGFKYPPAFLFLAMLGFLTAISFHFSVIISRLAERVRRACQDIALMQAKCEERKRGGD